MANVLHSTLTGSELHEPKGADSATAGSVYLADGAGSGTWQIPSYGEMYITGGSGATYTIALPAASAFTNLDNVNTIWVDGAYSDVTLDSTTGTFTCVTTGTYNVSFWTVFTTAAAAAGSIYKFKYALNGVPQTRQISTAKPTNGTDYCDTAATGIIPLTAGDTLNLQVAGDGTTSSTNIIIVDAGFSIHRV